MAGDFTFGIEEEYFLVDAETKLVARRVPEAFFKSAEAASRGRISREFLQAQVEVISSPHANMADARAELRHLRQTVAAVAAEHGLGILAAGTHPTALWSTAVQTPKERYDSGHGRSADDRPAQHAVRHARACRIARPRWARRCDVPHAALSAAVPWRSPRPRRSGNRAAPGSRAIGSPPMTSCRAPACPELFRTKEEFDAYVAALVRAGVIEDSSYVWWAIRPRSIIRRWNCARPTAARWSRIRLRSRRSTARWRAISISIPGATPISTRSRAPSWSRTSGARSAMACTAPS